MSVNHRQFPLFFKKTTGRRSAFGLEIVVAILVKFAMLGGIWWLFFAGKKITVDDSMIAENLFGNHRPVEISHKDRENSE